MIGSTSKFKTFHHFIDYVLNHISNINQFKHRISKEISNNKIKQDNNYERLKTNSNLLYDKMKSLGETEIQPIEEKNNSASNLYEEKLHN